MEIRSKTIADAHKKVCKEIFEDGEEIITEDREVTFEYPEPVLIIIEEPLKEPRVSSFCGFGEHAMEQYTNDLLNGSDNEFVYTYHERLFEYISYDMVSSEYGINLFQDYYLNQIYELIEKMKKEPTTRRAQAITWYPEHDLLSDNPPCLQRIQCMIRTGKLHMDVNFRSNDMISAFNQNAYALTKLQELIADELGLPVGRYTHYITSAHMYFERDAEELKKFKKEVYK